MAKDFDIIVFGASGFTGKFIIKRLAKLAPKDLKWAIAVEALEWANLDKKIPIFLADVFDKEKLKAVCEKTRVLISAVGPFRLYGEPVVSACIAAQTHYVDITGEPNFIENMIYTKNDLAEEKKVSIVHCCGFDSIPTDLGVLYLKQKFQERQQTPAWVEMFFKIETGEAGAGVHYGTYESLIHALGSVDELKNLRKKFAGSKLPQVGPKLKFQFWPHYEPRVQSWVVPFLFADPTVVRLSQKRLLQMNQQDPTIQLSAYVMMPSLLSIIFISFFFVILGLLSKFKAGVNFLLKNPKLCTFGFFSHEGPTIEQIEQSGFTSLFLARGYSKQPSKEQAPDVKMNLVVKGGEIGYDTTSTCVVLSALTMAKYDGKGKIPFGVLTPAAAFSQTDLIQQLDKNGLQFQLQ